MKTIRLKTVLDESGEVRIPVPPELHAGDTVEVEAVFRSPLESADAKLKWSQLLRSVDGIFEDHPLDIPPDAPPASEPFEE